MKIILATHNKDKQKELSMGLSEYEIVSLDTFSEIGDIPETGSTLNENAFIKARTVFELTGIPAIADDTGLEVEALNGAPGIYAARYAGENCSYEENVNKLIDEMKNIPIIERNAQFRTVMAYVDGNTELSAEGVVKGCITTEVKGVGGFGYDPVFYHPELKMTFAEMSIETKNRISHRGIAIRNLKRILHSYYNPNSIQETA